eukprot:6190230-Pleurochrysis_carterae.AAC.1
MFYVQHAYAGICVSVYPASVFPALEEDHSQQACLLATSVLDDFSMHYISNWALTRDKYEPI